MICTACAVMLSAASIGCEGQRGLQLWGDEPKSAPPPAPSDDAPSDRRSIPRERRSQMSAPAVAPPRPAISEVRLVVLHVQVPCSERERTEKIWNHVDENPLDSETLLRLKRNGVRVGVGRLDWWDAIKTGLDTIEGVRVTELDPVRLFPNYRLGFDIDRAPHEQTIFVVGEDGILTGSTFQQSRNVLCAYYVADPRRDDRVMLSVVPEVRQRLEGWQWISTPEGVAQIPRDNIFALLPAGFTLPMESGQFLLLAPNDRADYFGLVGGRFLTEEIDGRRYDSFIFATLDFTNVDADRIHTIRR